MDRGGIVSISSSRYDRVPEPLIVDGTGHHTSSAWRLLQSGEKAASCQKHHPIQGPYWGP